MAGNQNPIYTRVARISDTANAISLVANDFTGYGLNNFSVFTADKTNGSYVQKLRFKALGTTQATVARIFLNNGLSARANVCGAATGLTGTPQTTGGTLATGTYIGKVYTVDPWGAWSTNTAEVTVNTTGPTARIDWFWTANTGANNYILSVGARTSEPQAAFANANASYQMTTLRDATNFLAGVGEGMFNTPGGFSPNLNNTFYGEVSLPAVTAVATAATIDVDYPMNIALPPGYKILVGLGTGQTNSGWDVTVIAGDY
jgi:hypothetical protein